MTRAIFGGSHYIWRIIFLERRSIVGEAQASIFVAGAALGEVQVSLFVAGAALGEIQV